mmetsp:Transcript_12528/g.16879  ORF Transcript_12528/g.16879 Transcript_12528/m.16879 type:complete len:203 (-) Transcript_12528:38-646(-)
MGPLWSHLAHWADLRLYRCKVHEAELGGRVCGVLHSEGSLRDRSCHFRQSGGFHMGIPLDATDRIDPVLDHEDSLDVLASIASRHPRALEAASRRPGPTSRDGVLVRDRDACLRTAFGGIRSHGALVVAVDHLLVASLYRSNALQRHYSLSFKPSAIPNRQGSMAGLRCRQVQLGSQWCPRYASLSSQYRPTGNRGVRQGDA